MPPPLVAFAREWLGVLVFAKGITAGEGETEDLAERRIAGDAEGPAKSVVDEGEAALAVAANDDVALMVEKVAIARLALAHLPLQVLERFEARIETVGEGYIREGKRFMNVAIGCTGGKHRSVAMAEEIAARLNAVGIDAVAIHRDLGRE